MEVYWVWFCVTFVLGILIGVVLGIAGFGEKSPVGTLKIRYGEPEEDPYMFLELWEGTGDITKERTVNLVVSVTTNTLENCFTPK